MNKPAPPPATPRKALGRGLDALLGSPRPAAAAPAPKTPGPEGELRLVPLDAVQPNPFQPRRHFDPAALEELTASIRAQGVLQPLLVRPLASGYELIAGERRLRAAAAAGLEQVPVVVRPLNDETSLAIAIIENLQRADLNPIEQAQAFHELAQRFRLTQEQIAQRTGKDRATIANFLRLLRLDPEVVEMLRQGQLTPGHARPLLALDPEHQRKLAAQILAQGWSARRVEQHLARLQDPPPPPAPAPPRDPNEREAELQLARSLGAKVELKTSAAHRGTITVHFHGLDDFQRLYDRLVPPHS
ncbi:MAG: ParB/RepB/Spo0J family partition protein [Terriglobales bacterium]